MRCLLSLIMGIWCMAALAYAEETAVYLTLEEAVYAAIADSLEIQMAGVAQQAKAQDLVRAQAIYDAVLTADVSIERDESDVASAISGTKIITSTYNTGVTKTFPTGTTINLQFQNARTKSNSTFANLNPAIETLLGLTVTQPLLRNVGGLIDRSQIRMVQLEIEQHGLETHDAIEQVVADVEHAYWALASARSQMEQQGAALERARELLASAEDQAVLGLIEPADLLTVRITVEQRHEAFLVVRHDYYQAMDDLKRLLNRPGPEVIVPAEPMTLLAIDVSRADVLQRAMARRRDYQRIRRQLVLDDVTVQMQRNAAWPQLDLVGSLGANGVNTEYAHAIDDMLSGNHGDYFVGVTFSWPLGGGRDARGAKQQAELNTVKGLLQLKQTERDILFEVEARLRTLTLRQGQVEHRQRVMHLASDRLEKEMQQFHVGRSSIERVIDVNDEATVAKLNLTAAVIMHWHALTDLGRTENSLLDRYRQEVHSKQYTVNREETTQ